MDLLRDLEARWRGELRAVSLIAEIDASDGDVRRAIRALGRVYDDEWCEDDQHALLYRRYPACLAVSLAGIGAIEYAHGTYWPMVWEHADINPGPGQKRLWAEAFGDALDRFRLARFKDLPHRYLGEILMHAGVPEFCLEDLLKLLLDRCKRDPDLTADTFLAWACSPHYKTRLNRLDKPVRRFLEAGKDYAEDFVERCLDLLDRLREPEFETHGLRLPIRVIERARILAENGRIDLHGRRVPAEAYRIARKSPRVLLEPFGRGLLVELPAVEDAPEGTVAWQVKVGDTATTLVSSSPWPTARGVAPTTVLSIDKPVRKVHVITSYSEHQAELDLVDADDPLLVFSEEGKLVSVTSALAPEPVWLLCPAPSAAASHEIEFDGEWTELEETPAPHGWDGWRLRRVDVSKARALRCGSGGWRTVHQARRARLEVRPPLAHVRGEDGAPVHDHAPMIELPADAVAPTCWSIRVRRPGASVTLSTLDLTVTEQGLVDPWARVPRPLVGGYELTVRGPLGRGFSRTLQIFEGLLTDSDPRWRPIGPRGLAPARVWAWAGRPGLRFNPSIVELGPNDPTALFQISGADGAYSVEVTPPHMAVSLGTTSPDAWSVRPLQLNTDALGEETLHVRLPGVVAARLVASSSDKDLQTIDSARTRGRAEAIFDLSRLVDTVRHAGAAQIEVELEGRRYPVARCRPRSLAEKVTIDQAGQLVLHGESVAEGVVAGIYQVCAPWRAAVVVPFTEELQRAPLPPALLHAGPLEVALRIEDPWVPESWPAWPSGRDVFHVAGGRWLSEGVDSGEAMLAGLLAGSDEHPSAEAVPFAAALYARHDDLLRYKDVSSARHIAATVIASHPAEFLRCVAAGSPTAASVEAPLIHAGLATLPPRHYLDRDEELALWAISPLAALLASSHALRQYDDMMIERAVDLCGPIARDLLLGEDDPAAGVGAFDENTRRLAQMPIAQLDGLWSAASIVPQGLLSVDERASAARQLFDVRERNGINQICFRAARVGREMRTLLAGERGTGLARMIDARGLNGGWEALPGYSLALAYVARSAARDPDRFGNVARAYITDYAALARHAPRLVTVDLILAELHLIGTDLA